MLRVSEWASRRQPVALCCGVVVLCACAVLLALTPIVVQPGQGPAAVALVAIAGFACSGEVVLARYLRDGELTDRLRLDATGVIAIVALWIAGPAVALGAIAAPELVTRWRGEDRLRALPRLANLASYAAASLVAAATLALLGSPPARAGFGLHSAPALFVAGIIWFLVNYAVTRGLVAMLAGGQPVLATVRRELVPALPSVAVMAGCAVITALMITVVGAPGLAPLALAVLAPQLAVAAISVLTPRARELEIDAGRLRYAVALCDQLRLPRRQRRIVAAAARGDSGVIWSTGGLSDIWYAVGAARFYEQERFDGRGSLGLSGTLIPIESRVLAVADAWAKLTARGTLAMTQEAAVAALERHQPRFDPRVIAAAHELIAADVAAASGCRRVPAPTQAARRFTIRIGARLA